MMSVSESSKHYPYSGALSNSCPNVSRGPNSCGDSSRPMPRSMRTFRSRFDEAGGQARAVESTVFSGPIDKNLSLELENWCQSETTKGNISTKLSNLNFSINSNSNSGSTSSGDLSLGPSSSCLAEEVNSPDYSLAFSDVSSYSSDISEELQRLAATASSLPALNCPQKDTKWIGKFVKSRNLEEDGQNKTLNKSGPSSAPVAATSGTLETDNLNVLFKLLVEELESGFIDLQRNAAAQIRLYAKNSMDNRVLIANSGAIKPLVPLLHSLDSLTQENAVTALLNLSLHENNKYQITEAGAIRPLIHVLNTGTPTAKENAACTLLSLSLIENNKVTIARAGAIPPLVSLLTDGSLRGKKDAAATLYTLSSLADNKIRIIQAEAIRPLVDLMADPSYGMVDKAAVLLSILASLPQGRAAIVEEGGIPVLVEVVEVGSQRGKEHATATLLQLCEDSQLYRALVLREGAIPPLVALSQSGTARARQKALALLQHLRGPRQGRDDD